jgi:hypothetical protein
MSNETKALELYICDDCDLMFKVLDNDNSCPECEKTNCRTYHNPYDIKIRDLEAKLAKAVEVLKFYGDGKHWTTSDHEENIFIKIVDDDWEHRGTGNGFVGGKLARETLKELGEE